ncbi:S8 family serine peptidase [Pontibacillus yanchengensis]|uniref:S8 family serine peptidase n=2 Tax=Pontibacillus yanchengensis TaxID=462910 RepID=A0A6I4ZX41_9BACI|nr:S8 family peptidase [Pontibacillus yanchengensis]MYL34668.1 S8 family serine peptidase [Pontibacillus yanchengensis]MYL54537.1 S8 family serine peptidase [Pontibacillus yanchengensis]
MNVKKIASFALAASIAVSPVSLVDASPNDQVVNLKKESEQNTEKGDFVKGEVIVKFNDNATNKTAEQLNVSGEIKEDTDEVDSNFLVLEVGNVEEVVKALNKNPDVEYAEPNYKFQSTFTPNDSLYQGYQYGPQSTYTDEAWNVTKGASSQEIAVIDSGVDYNHPDLDDKTIKGYDFVDNDYDPMDEKNHGTHVAGTAAAETDNATGIAGMAPNTSILAVRALNAQGSGTLADIADAIVYAADQGAEVINLSLGCNCDTTTLENAVNYAWDKGSVVVAAAGNDGVSTTFEPASYNNVIAVGAIDQNDQKASFSNYGTWVDVVAPGVSIAATVPGNGYAYMSGTSMAAPHVSGLAGILASQGRSNTEIRQAIEETTDSLSGTGVYSKYGKIDSLEAVNY